MIKYVGTKVSQDFIPTANALAILCRKKYLNRSQVIRETIRKEVQELLKQYPDVAELIERTALLYSIKHKILFNT